MLPSLRGGGKGENAADIESGMSEAEARVRALPKVELHQHVDGSIPAEVTWELMRKNRLNPVSTLDEMRGRLELQADEEGTLLAYLDKMHYPLWITQFYENIVKVTEAIVDTAAVAGVRTLELRYSPVIHTFAGLTPRQSIRAVLSGMNHAGKRHSLKLGLVVIAMRQHGPHIAKILARQAIAEAQHLHERTGVVGFDIAGPEHGNPPRLFKSSYDIARLGHLGLTVHAGEDAPPDYVWQAVDELGAQRIGHGCAAVSDPELLRRLARDRIPVECCLSSNYDTGAVKRGRPHPILTFLEAGVPVAICCDNTTVSRTDQTRESLRVAELIGVDLVEKIHREAENYCFIRPESALPGLGD
jgi:adenosine deaminase